MRTANSACAKMVEEDTPRGSMIDSGDKKDIQLGLGGTSEGKRQSRPSNERMVVSQDFREPFDTLELYKPDHFKRDFLSAISYDDNYRVSPILNEFVEETKEMLGLVEPRSDFELNNQN